MLQHIDVVMLVLRRLQKSFNPTFQLFVKLANDGVSLRVIVVNGFLGIVELGGGIDGRDGKSALG